MTGVTTGCGGAGAGGAAGGTPPVPGEGEEGEEDVEQLEETHWAGTVLLAEDDATLRWKAAIREPTGAALDGDLVWTAEQSGRLFALDRRSGAQRRVVPLGQRIVSAPSVALGRVWVGLEDRSLVGIDAHAEQPPWRASLPAALVGGVVEWQDRVLVPTAGKKAP